MDLLIHSAAQIVTVAGPGPKAGENAGDIGLVADGAIAIENGKIAAVGPSYRLREEVRANRELDASGKVVLPGFVDAHTHLVYAGTRQDEFVLRLHGVSYTDLLGMGEGIVRTVRKTREASVADIMTESQARLRRMLAHGTTTAEAKTGYGLNLDDEVKLLDAIYNLNLIQPVELVATYLGAHAVPPEFSGNPDGYVDQIVNDVLPIVAGTRQVDFCDVFCETGAFSVEQSRRILDKARSLGLRLKVHADEFGSTGGAALAAELQATSADHLLQTTEIDILAMAGAGVIGVLLPGTPLGLGQCHFANARLMINNRLPIALGTDLNPGTCPCESMPFIIALACRMMRLTPAEAIVAATLNAAHAIGKGETVGSIEVGKQADLVFINGPSYVDLAYRFGTNPIQAVMKKGRVVWAAQGA
ncbi:MAG: imidazolonepropionase [Chloroflexi bacterium]|nr:imidazolonepropionase [Chloroflexota bacterium]